MKKYFKKQYIALGVFSLLLLLVFSAQRSVLNASVKSNCTQLDSSYPAYDEECVYEKKNIEYQEYLALLKTKQSLPLPTLTALPKDITPITYSEVPDSDIVKEPKSLDPINFIDGPPIFRNVTSIWVLATIPSDDNGSYLTLYAVSRSNINEDKTTSGIFIYPNRDGDLGKYKSLIREWVMSGYEDVSITDVRDFSVSGEDMKGILEFTTDGDRKGTIDLATLKIIMK